MTPDAPLIDPTSEELAALLDAAGGAAGRDWGEVLKAFQAKPDGAVTVVPTDGADDWIGWEVCWWHDRLGRRHWSIGTNVHRPALDGMPITAGGCLLWWHPDRHPLEWIAPPLSCGWRERGGRREFVVMCRCGVVGTPQSVGWMGWTCGPCFDREQEGVARTSRPVGVVTQVGLTPSGLLVVVGGLALEADHDGRTRTTVSAYERPWDGPPLWERSWDGFRLVAAGGDLVAVAGEWELELIDARHGSDRRTFRTGPERILQLTFAGPGQRTVVALYSSQLRFWDTDATVSYPRHIAHLADVSVGGGLAATHDSSRVASLSGLGDAGVEVYDVASGRLIERLEASFLASGGGHACLADGSLCLLGTEQGRWQLRRWKRASPGFLAALFGWRPRRPDRVIEWEHRSILATDGDRILTRSGDSLHLVEGQTLRSLGTFTPNLSLCPMTTAFAPGDALILGHGQTLAVWPWRELFGVE